MKTKNENIKTKYFKSAYRKLIYDKTKKLILVGSYEYYLLYYINSIRGYDDYNDGNLELLFYSDISKLNTLQLVNDYFLSFSITDELYTDRWADDITELYFSTDKRYRKKYLSNYYKSKNFKYNYYITLVELRDKLNELRTDINKLIEQLGEYNKYIIYRNYKRTLLFYMLCGIFNKNIIRLYNDLFDLYGNFLVSKYELDGTILYYDELLFEYNIKNINTYSNITIEYH